jgi:hypothetical protein
VAVEQGGASIGNVRDVPDDVPLSTLLSWVWIASTIEVDNAAEAEWSDHLGRPFRISLPMWANGLRLVADEGVTVEELRGRTRAGCNIGGLERWGWLSVGDGGPGRRPGYGSHRGVTARTTLRPTPAGRHARQLWPSVVARVEMRWRERFGSQPVEALGAALQEALAGIDRPMPWAPPEVSPADGFRTHVIDGGTTDEAPSLVGLLGQVLTARTLDHERGGGVSRPIGANLLRAIDEEAVRLRDLPRLTGLSKEAVAMATGFLRRTGMVVHDADRSIRLSPTGLEALAEHRQRDAAEGDGVLRGALEAIVAQRDELAAGLVPPDACWRGEGGYLAQTKRLLADPLAALPRHPMVLHRGGWPDGS